MGTTRKTNTDLTGEISEITSCIKKIQSVFTEQISTVQVEDRQAGFCS